MPGLPREHFGNGTLICVARLPAPGESARRDRAATAPLQLRLVPAADHHFEADGALDTLANTLNDWLEGARRLTADDSAHWRPGATPAAGAQTTSGSAEPADGDDLAFFGF